MEIYEIFVVKLIGWLNESTLPSRLASLDLYTNRC